MTEDSPLRKSRQRYSTPFVHTNTVSRLDYFTDSLNQLSNQIHNLQKQTNTSGEYLSQIQKQLVERLQNKQIVLLKPVHQLSNSAHQIINTQRKKTESIQQLSDQLFSQTLILKSRFISLRTRIQCIQRSLGFYGGVDKYKS